MTDTVFGIQEPRFSHLPEWDDDSDAKEALEFINKLKNPDGEPITPLPYQSNWIHDMNLKCEGRYAAFEVVMVQSRQGGKSFGTLLAILYRLFVKRQNVLFTAQKLDTATDLFNQLEKLVRANRGLLKHVLGYSPSEGSDQRLLKGISRAQSIPSLNLRWGNWLRVSTRSEDSGRGMSPDVVVLEEAYDLKNSHLRALKYTLQGRSVQRSPQLWYVSSAPLVDSDVLHAVVKSGRAGQSSTMFYTEFSAPEDTPTERYGDPEVLSQACPGLGYLVSLQTLQANLESSIAQDDLAGFAQEVLSIPEQISSEDSLFDPLRWQELVQEPSEALPSPSETVLAVFVSSDRSSSAVAMAYRLEGETYIEILECQRGTSWIPNAVEDYKHLTTRPVIVDSHHNARLVDQLKVRKIRLRELKPRELLDSNTLFYDLYDSAEFHHLDDEALNLAIRTADQKQVNGGWRFIPGSSGKSISPLMSAAYALYFLNQFTQSKRKVEADPTPKRPKRKVIL